MNKYLIFGILITTVLLCGCVGNESTMINSTNTNYSDSWDGGGASAYVTQINNTSLIITPTIEPIPIITPNVTITNIVNENLLIDNISNDLNNFNLKGWSHLYELNEFDCSKMSVYMWSYIRNKYNVPVKIVVSPNLRHAWLAIRVKDVGETNRYLNWTIKGVDYYFIESTIPKVVNFEENIYLGNQLYQDTKQLYTNRIFLNDDPLEANDFTGTISGWNTDFRLTKQDLDKLEKFNNQYL